MKMYTEIDGCRICGNRNLVPVLSLGNQYLSGVFPNTKDHLEYLTSGPLDLVKCHGDDCCGLLQLRQSYSPSEMYGGNYGYRSSLNHTMVDHLHDKVRRITNLVELGDDDNVIDIGSNDGTLLKAYPQTTINLIGIDPAGDKFKEYYPSNIKLMTDFFSAKTLGGLRAKVVTSIAMFYDLEDPMSFMQDVHETLTDDGVWVLEQSYMPMMLYKRSYDTICHEHLEYYGLRQIKWMADRVGFRFLDVELNDVNGGSFSCTLVKDAAPYKSTMDIGIIDREDRLGLSTLNPYIDFAAAVGQSKQKLKDFLAQDRFVCGLGASTKGNIILQHCGVTEEQLPFIGDVNSDKFGCFTPGTQIPIVSEQEVLMMKPDYLLVLPWHFRCHFETDSKYKGSTLVFPLPALTTVRR
jgi:hypothetical protein